jgi:septum site-determining protein MinC
MYGRKIKRRLHMNNDVLFEKKENTLIITLDKDSNYKEIKDKLKEVIESSSDIFEGIEAPIKIQGRRLIDSEEEEILGILKEKTDIEVEIERPKQMGLANIDNIFNKDTNISNTKFIRGTVRSGQRLEYEGSIVIIGDVNGGSEIIAEENIIVLGNLRGFAHAGAKGNRSSFIAANNINPTQLRIADIILRNFDKRNEIGNTYDYAYINMGEILIDR